MELLNIFLNIISAAVVLLAIIFEGKLKASDTERLSFHSFFKELKLVSPFGWILISLMLLLNFGNSLISHQDKIKQEKEFENDTIRYTKIIYQLENQRIQDSLRIKELKNEVINNGYKSDSIRIQVADNAIKALEEQRLILERKKENSYLRMVSEVEDNLRKIYINYEEKHIKGFVDTTFFISTRLNNTSIKAYIDVSNNYSIIEHLLETSESIDAVNMYADQVLQSESKSKNKEKIINMFLKNVETNKYYLLSIYKRTYGLSSYKQYESLDFSKELPKMDENELKRWLEIENLIKTTDAKIIYK